MGNVGTTISKAVNSAVEPVKNVVTNPGGATFGDYLGTVFPGSNIGLGGPAGAFGAAKAGLNALPSNPITDAPKNVLDNPGKATWEDYLGTVFPGANVGLGGPAGVFGAINSLKDAIEQASKPKGDDGDDHSEKSVKENQPGASQALPIQQIYRQYLGRDATPEEVDYLDQFAKEGHISPFQISQLIQGMPEYQNNALKNYGQQYSDMLGQSDQRILGMAGNQITGQLAQQGRSIGGSTYTNAFAQAAANLAGQRQQQLASFYQPGFQNIMGQQANQGQMVQNNALSRGQEDRQRNYELQNYFQQQNDFNNFLKGQQTRDQQNALLQSAANIFDSGISGFAGGFGFKKGYGTSGVLSSNPGMPTPTTSPSGARYYPGGGLLNG